jgi:hypothetical protein
MDDHHLNNIIKVKNKIKNGENNHIGERKKLAIIPKLDIYFTYENIFLKNLMKTLEFILN